MAKKPIPKTTPSAQTARVASPPTANAAAAELPVATIEFAQNNSVLYPLEAAQGTTATLTLPAGSTQVVVHFAIKDQASPTFPPINVASGDVAEIPWQWISTCIGHTVLIWYEAVVGGVRKESLVLELEIQQVREEDLRESMPEFAHAKLEWSTLWLNMFTFEGDETIRIKAWPMIQAGQRLFVVVAGNQHQVPFRFTWAAYDHLVTEAEAHLGFVFEFSLLRDWLSRLEDYSSLTCHCGVIWDGTGPAAPVSTDNPLPENAQDFHQRSTTLLRVDPQLDLSAPHLRESVEVHPDDWQVNPINTVSGGHVFITYEGMTEGDHVCAHAYGPSYGPVSLGCQDVTAEDSSLSFDLAPDIIAALFNQTMTLNYSVQFNNNLPRFSPDRAIKVLSPQLTTPSIEEATAGEVDLTTFEGNATGLVPIWDYAVQGQCCWMWVSGMSADDSPYQFDILRDEPLTAQWLRGGVDASIPRAELKKLADCGEFVLHFAASFDGVCNRATALEFTPKSFKLVPEYMVLLAPTVIEAVGSDLTAWNGRDGVHVAVDYVGSHPSQSISVDWTRPDGSRWPLAAEPGSTAGAVIFFVPREAVIESIGKTVKINYTVTRVCQMQTSADLNLHVSVPVPVRLPMPVVPQATPPAVQGAMLDLRNFPGDVDITIDPWWFILLGQNGWLQCSGTKTDGSPYTIKVMTREPIKRDDLNGVSRILPRVELEKLLINSTLTITFKVATDEGSLETDAVVFPTLSLRVGREYRDLTDFNDRDFRGWEVGTGAPDPRDISLEPAGNGFVVKNYTYSTNNIGPILQRTFRDLETGRAYRFSVKARRINHNNPWPKLSLRQDSVQKTGVTELVDQAWHTLSFTFVAASATVLLDIYSHEAAAELSGNDYYMDDFLVEEV
ncbi:hypothetical protein MOQ67_22370 [Pseudomonas sp. LY-1]|uniref:hypothetical protein n=1 Tax=Pseudomonas TaxID=286 RepID=UPI00209E4308|nr:MULTISPECIES: hypothetical protein [Pseudomonas]MCP1507978.1 hypothetical protein [Pseudomonas marginalis]MCP1525482.1 hypothetical protein [Pseudomonas marginalis]MDQ0499204.1 hypothetical protein [Pseudomonas marginalis]